jgi:GMP synthase-like glutamine amidotransferase
MKIAILQTGHLPDDLAGETSDYDRIFIDMLDGHGFGFDAYAVVDGIFPEGADAADGWLITGSRHGVYEDHPWIGPLERLIRDIHTRGLPLIGICFGHQIIAQALGGKVEKYPGGWAVGNTEYRLGEKVLALNAWHQDQVTELPEGARVLGGNAFCENAVLAYGDSIWSIQPHPEFTARFLEGLIKTRGPGVVPDARLAAAKSRLKLPDNNADIAAHMAAFFKKERA